MTSPTSEGEYVRSNQIYQTVQEWQNWRNLFQVFSVACGHRVSATTTKKCLGSHFPRKLQIIALKLWYFSGRIVALLPSLLWAEFTLVDIQITSLQVGVMASTLSCLLDRGLETPISQSLMWLVLVVCVCVAPFSQEDSGILSCRNTLWVAAFMVLGEVVKKVWAGGWGRTWKGRTE